MTACDLGAVTKPWEISRKASYDSFSFIHVIIGPVMLDTACVHTYMFMISVCSYICVLVKVAELVTSEFFEQGDRERSELKLTPSVSLVCFSITYIHMHQVHS